MQLGLQVVQLGPGMLEPHFYVHLGHIQELEIRSIGAI